MYESNFYVLQQILTGFPSFSRQDFFFKEIPLSDRVKYPVFCPELERNQK